MGSYYVCDWFIQGDQYLLLDSFIVFILYFGIYYIQVFIGFQYVQIDMIEGKRQWYMKLVDVGGDFVKVV